MSANTLVTGLSGLIGTAFLSTIEDRSSLRALNRSAIADVETHQADISDYDAIRPAFDGIETVVHLAAKAGEHHPVDDLLKTNVRGTYNVYKAAVEAGCKRVVFASSGATVSGYELIEPYKTLVSGEYSAAPTTWDLIDHNSPVKPTGVYGSTKVWGEALGNHFVDTNDISIICLRIGYVNRNDRPGRPRDYAIWCSQRDIVSAIHGCMTADENVRFAKLFATSRNKWGYRDLSLAKNIAHFEPEDAAEEHRTD